LKDFSYGIIPYILSDSGIEILLMKSSSGMNEFDFIKGKIEETETPSECCIREVKEEIGVLIHENKLEQLTIQKNKKKDIGLFFIDWTFYINQNILLDKNEVFELRWFNISNLPKISKNQSMIVTDILIRFNKTNFYQKNKKG
jgi:8-oxo-dGTP pyrophosphatase MutT (NUDIX family)